MNQTNILIEEQDYYFCKAFQKIINLPSSKLVKALGNLESLAAAKEYFANLSSESYDCRFADKVKFLQRISALLGNAFRT